jgi:hypothetical protein
MVCVATMAVAKNGSDSIELWHEFDLSPNARAGFNSKGFMNIAFLITSIYNGNS